MDAILVSVETEAAYIRVVGRGSFAMGPALKRFGLAMVQCGRHRFVVDMADCVSLDSSFMGVLAGLALRVNPMPQGCVKLTHVQAQPSRSLRALGLASLLDIHEDAAPGTASPAAPNTVPPDLACLDLAAARRDRRVTAETALQAHEDLVAAHAENLPKFKDVLAYLREDLARLPIDTGPTAPGEDPRA
ncbi:MAG: STAS domain-containing protein [Lentisphaerae bacterium]|nr:STAS domain-containing protein [Lentisphaerota bacterium]